MSDEVPERPLDVLLRTVSLSLQPQGGRVFAHHATKEKLSRQTIELKCERHDPQIFFGNTIVIGEEVHPRPKLFEDNDEDEEKPVEEETGWRLNTIPIMLSIYEVDEAWLSESAEQRGGDPLVGQFSYHPRINTDDGVVNDVRPSCSAWIGVGGDTFRMIRDHVLDFTKYDFRIGVDVLFPKEGVENGWTGRTVNWDGDGQLPITSAVAVWTKEDWSSDFRRKERPGPPKEADYVPPREHVELMEANHRLEATIKAMMTPLWIIAAVVFFWAIFHR
jgi:hypothetical protein